MECALVVEFWPSMDKALGPLFIIIKIYNKNLMFKKCRIATYLNTLMSIFTSHFYTL